MDRSEFVSPEVEGPLWDATALVKGGFKVFSARQHTYVDVGELTPVQHPLETAWLYHGKEYVVQDYSLTDDGVAVIMRSRNHPSEKRDVFTSELSHCHRLWECAHVWKLDHTRNKITHYSCTLCGATYQRHNDKVQKS